MPRRTIKTILILIVVLQALVLGTFVSAASVMDSFIDPKDGKFDASAWLLDHKGFLPIVEIITEPAVGYGAALGLVFFHQSMDEKIAQQQVDTGQMVDGRKAKILPPSMSGIFGFKTENDTWGAGGFHAGSWKGDNIRYMGGLAKTSVNIKYYGQPGSPIYDEGLDYNLEGWLLIQNLMFRIEDSDVFVGGKLTYFDATASFDIGTNPTGIEVWELDFRNFGAGFAFQYDSRDNIFAPNYGIHTDISTMFYSGKGLLDQTREYQITDVKNRWYWPMMPDLTMGWRVEANLSTGSVPFYALPYIDLRGIPLNRYQGDSVLTTEFEGMYQVSDRWGLVPFIGVGAATDAVSEIGSSDPKFAGGLGFRYLIARKLRLTYGADIARGPDEWSIYLTVGTGL